ncbi:MAG TPA: lipopolysaccharide heptosyltransferase II [Gammaproteobacteria bacterium]|nr:lipopolysaccharide heptosyltransferase II [Gammaproteobacteria bacterium]
MSAPARILVVGPSWVGDMVTARALFRRLADRFPQASLDVLAPGWSLPLLERMPEVGTGIQLHAGHGELALARRWRLGRTLRMRRYDWAIVLPRSFKAALVPAIAGIPRRTGFLGEYRYGLLTDIRRFDAAAMDQTVKRFLALGAAEDGFDEIPQPTLRVEPERARALRMQFGLPPQGRHIVLAPGAEYGAAKRWPAPSFAALARHCAVDGRDVLLIGSAKEAAIGAEIRQLADTPGVVDLCGRTELVDALDLLGAADAAVCNDSGLMHVAAAAGAPLVALYGSSSPHRTPPLTRRASVVYKGLSCSPCFARECPLGHLDCLRTIETDEVIRALEALPGTDAVA